MKVKDLFEEQRVIKGNVEVPHSTTKLDYEGVTVRGNFSCSNTKIKSLEGAPTKVTGGFGCNNTLIKSLKGAPSYVGNNFHCDGTEILSFEGAPSYVGGSFSCYVITVPSLHNIHKYIKHIGGTFTLSRTVISHIIGVMLIKGLKKINLLGGNTEQNQVERIVNKHLSEGRDVHECQEELLEAGLKEYAKL